MGCVKTIQSSLEKIANPQDFQINFAARTLTIKTSKTPEEISKIINQAGYGAKLITQSDQQQQKQEDKTHFRTLLYKGIIAGILGIILFGMELLMNLVLI